MYKLFFDINKQVLDNDLMIKEKEKVYQTSYDKFLNGSILVEQLIQGGRSGSDTILLSASVPAKPGETILEIGTGNGTAAIALAKQIINLRILAIDIDPINLDIAKRNVILNKLSENIQTLNEDILKKDIKFNINQEEIKSFDHIFMNPPYFDINKIVIPRSDQNKIAKSANFNLIDGWLDISIKLLKHNGTITIINKVSNLDQIMRKLSKYGSLIILPLVAHQNKEADRMIINFKMGSKSNTRILNAVVLHEEGGEYSNDVEEVLRGRARIDINKSKYFYQI